MANLSNTIPVRGTDGGLRNVVRHSGCAVAMLCDGAELCRAFETVSWRGFILFVCRTSVSFQDNGVPVRANREVFHGLGEPFILLGISGMHGGGDGDPWGIFTQSVLAKHVQLNLQ